MFDPATVADAATYTDPARYPIGSTTSSSTAAPAIVDGAETGERPGRLLRGRDADRDRTSTAVTETAAVARLPGGPLAYTLRRSPRSRGLRVVIHPDRGVVVTVPPAGAPRLGDPEGQIEAFLAEREPWLRRHLARQARDRADARGTRRPARRRHDPVPRRPAPPPHRAGAPGVRRSTVERIGGTDEDELVVHLAAADRRSTAALLEAWFKPRARAAIEREIARHAAALGVSPTALSVRDQRTRWGSASRQGRLAFSWRLILAPPEALETVVIHELAHLRVFGHGPRFWALVASRRPDHKVWRRWLRDHSTELHGALDDARGVTGETGGGGDEGTRTPDPCDANAVLFQLSYIPTDRSRHVRGLGTGRNGSTGLPGTRRPDWCDPGSCRGTRRLGSGMPFGLLAGLGGALVGLARRDHRPRQPA